MKSRLKKFHRIRAKIKKAFYFLTLSAAAFFAVLWLRPYYPDIERFFRFGYVKINTSEIDVYYDLLSKNEAAGKDLVLGLGVKDEDSLQIVSDRLKGLMGLGDYTIWLSHHDAEKPPAYIKQLGYGHMGILISKKVTERREEESLLVHELTHIYAWNLNPSIFGKCDQEKLVDCSGVFLGLGVLTLNGLTDESVLLPGERYETRKKLFGYLEPEQFGYLLARYCAERGITEETITPFLNSTGRKYFNMGYNYLKKSGRVTRVYAEPALGVYWCSKCGSLTRTPLSEKIKGVTCPDCRGQ